MRYFGYMLPAANWFRPPGMEIAQDFEGIGEMRRRPEPAAALGAAVPLPKALRAEQAEG